MKTKSIILILILSLLVVWTACDEWVTSIDPLIEQVAYEKLTAEGEIPFVLTGVRAQFCYTNDVMGVTADLLSDQLIFDYNVRNATYPTFFDINSGVIRLDDNSVDDAFNRVGRLRFHADDLISRVGEITFTNTAVRDDALTWANVFGGIGRFYYAANFGLDETTGGGVIDAGPFIPSADMYALSTDKFKAALTTTTNAKTIRLINSLIARNYLFVGDYANAKTYADAGMVQGDAQFASLHSTESDNYYWQQAGHYRCQCAADFRFKAYLVADPAEVARCPLDSTKGYNQIWYYMQNKYPTDSSPIPFMTWQENELMLAELDLRAADDASALTKINLVRASHGLADLAAADMQVLITERDKELFVQGTRLVDQRRFNADYGTWHLPPGRWMYLPITERERLINPNLPDV